MTQWIEGAAVLVAIALAAAYMIREWVRALRRLARGDVSPCANCSCGCETGSPTPDGSKECPASDVSAPRS